MNNSDKQVIKQFLLENENLTEEIAERLAVNKNSIKYTVLKILKEDSDFIDLVKGDIGPQGEQGPEGKSGKRGSKGEIGPEGKPGKDGIDGKDAQIDLEQLIKNLIVKLKNDKYFRENVKGQKGDPGEDGSTGWGTGGGLSESDVQAVIDYQLVTTQITFTDSPYSVLQRNSVLFVNPDSGTTTIHLPAGIQNKNIRISHVGSNLNTVRIIPNGSELLFGENSTFILYKNETIDIYYSLTNGWW